MKKLVRFLTKWAWQHEIEVAEGICKIQEMHAKPGSMELEIENNPALSQWIAHCFAGMVASSPNYTEMKFDLLAKGEKFQWLTVLIQKGNGKTPHELRREAEEKLEDFQKQYGI